MIAPDATILVTGASGYIGGRLVGELLDAGYRVRCLARTPAKLDAAPWAGSVEIVQGDIEGDLSAAVDGVDVVYYLIHSIGESSDWMEREAAGAANLRGVAVAASVQRIVYLGGLGAKEDAELSLSTHLQSRHRVGEVLADGPIPVTELRAAVIIGSGSASFEMLRLPGRGVAGDGDPQVGQHALSADRCARRPAVPRRRARLGRLGGSDRQEHAAVQLVVSDRRERCSDAAPSTPTSHPTPHIAGCGLKRSRSQLSRSAKQLSVTPTFSERSSTSPVATEWRPWSPWPTVQRACTRVRAVEPSAPERTRASPREVMRFSPRCKAKSICSPPMIEWTCRTMIWSRSRSSPLADADAQASLRLPSGGQEPSSVVDIIAAIQDVITAIRQVQSQT